MNTVDDDGHGSRGDYPAMVRRALDLYGKGLDREAVLRECYGVPFPAEFFALADEDPEQFDWATTRTDLPWQLAIPPEAGGPDLDIPYAAVLEGSLIARDPDLVPLAELMGRHTRYGGRVPCYRLSGLAAGDHGVVLVEAEGDGHAEPGAPSLLHMLRLHFVARLDQMEQERDDPANVRVPVVFPEDVEEAQASLRRVDALRERVGA